MADNTIYQLLAKVISEVPAVAKKERNQAQNFSFRGIDAVVNAVSPVLIKHGVIVAPTLHNYVYEQIPIGDKGKLAGHARVSVQYTFYGPQGDSISASVAAEAMDYGDKATAKAMSVAFRTALLQTLTLPTDDKDPDQDTYERSAPPVDRDPDPLVSEEKKQQIQVAFADIGLGVDAFLTLAGIRFDEWDRLREKGREQLLRAFTKAKNEIPPDPSAHMDKPRVATVTPIIQPVPDEVKAAHPSNGVPKGDEAPVKQLVALRAILRGNAYSEAEQLDMASDHAGRIIGNFNELTKKEASGLIGILSPKKD